MEKCDISLSRFPFKSEIWTPENFNTHCGYHLRHHPAHTNSLTLPLEILILLRALFIYIYLLINGDNYPITRHTLEIRER